MTDQALTGRLEQAREWAKGKLLNPGNDTDGVKVALFISALPDEWIDADKVRDVINGQLSSYPHGTVGHHAAEEIACKLEPLFPDPQFILSTWHDDNDNDWSNDGR